MSHIGDELYRHGCLDGFNSVVNTYLIVVDGTNLHSSEASSCPSCLLGTQTQEWKVAAASHHHHPELVAQEQKMTSPYHPNSLHPKIVTTSRIVNWPSRCPGLTVGKRNMAHWGSLIWVTTCTAISRIVSADWRNIPALISLFGRAAQHALRIGS